MIIFRYFQENLIREVKMNMRYCVKNISVYIAKYTINCTKLLKIFGIII